VSCSFISLYILRALLVILQCILRETGYECVGWVHLVQKRGNGKDLVNAVMKFSAPIKGEELLDSMSD
jgi:hypothetical protein